MSDDHLLMCCCCRAACQHIVEEKDAEIERLRDAIRRLAEQDATLSVQGGSVTVTMDATLTEAEHDALEFAVETGRVAIHDEATLRNLLERLT